MRRYAIVRPTPSGIPEVVDAHEVIVSRSGALLFFDPSGSGAVVRAYGPGQWSRCDDVGPPPQVHTGRAIRGCGDCETMTHCETHRKTPDTYPKE